MVFHSFFPDVIAQDFGDSEFRLPVGRRSSSSATGMCFQEVSEKEINFRHL
jgi:hypothetical protein